PPHAAGDRRHRLVATVGRDPHPGDSHPVALTVRARPRAAARACQRGGSSREKHTLSGDFAPRIAALLHVKPGYAAVTSAPPMWCCATETLKKRALSQHPHTKSACESVRMCYFPRRFSLAR